MRQPARLRWLFLGQSTMSAAALRVVAGWRPLAVLTGSAAMGTKVADLAAERGFETRIVERLGDAPAAEHGDLGTIDVGVCCGWSERLRAGALRWPRLGWLNLHPSRLPAWRGADPIAWQMVTGARRLGCAVHWMTERFDDGPVVASGDTAPLEETADRMDAMRACGSTLGTLVDRVLSRLAAGQAVPGEPQGEDGAVACPPLAMTALLDPGRATARQVDVVARAFSPSPGIALTCFPVDRRFVEPRIGDPLERGDRPGSVCVSGATVAVACRDRWIHGVLKPLGG